MPKNLVEDIVNEGLDRMMQDAEKANERIELFTIVCYNTHIVKCDILEAMKKDAKGEEPLFSLAARNPV